MTERYVPFTIVPDAIEDHATRYAAVTVETARRYIGVREQGQNRGPIVERILAFVGLRPGNPWCAAVVAEIMHRAAGHIGSVTTCPRVGSASKLYRAGLQQKRTVPPSQARYGDVFVQAADEAHVGAVMAGRLRKGHTGIVAWVDRKAGTYGTLEGNTSAERGEREGQGFYARTRKLDDPRLVGFVRFAALEVA